ncbi:MAG: hypothetical protein ABII90_12395 [Bacteroidota bacterium]
MKPLLYISLIMLLTKPVNYEKIFHSEYDNAVSFIEQNHKVFNKVIKTDAEKKNMMLSIIFPELIRYSLFRDFFETKSLEYGYVQYGAGMVDFSIGRFQMKPSFVETLEERVKRSNELMNKYHEITAFKDTAITGTRRERVERLRSLTWQFIYLECFYDITSERFKDIKWRDDIEKLRFYATAYNHNFCASKEEIEKWIDAKTFPYGAQYDGEQYSYSDISVYFFKNHLQKVTVMN